VWGGIRLFQELISPDKQSAVYKLYLKQIIDEGKAQLAIKGTSLNGYSYPVKPGVEAGKNHHHCVTPR
jgi:hypothetical protein